MAQTCRRCGGEGAIIQTPCPNCRGEGRVKVTSDIEVKIPAGVYTGAQLRVRGKGEEGTVGRGDLYVLIEVKHHPVFKRHDNDIVTETDISLTKAILGGDIEVSTLDGKVMMKIPPGTQGGKIFRLRGKGVPDLHSGAVGDEMVRVDVDIPTRLTPAQRKLMEEFARLSGEDPAKGGFTDKIKRAFK
jgi:molecular chaperone DnaJ